MITNPLNLSGSLRPAPRNFDYLYWINAVLIALFFSVFGSRFVLSPGLGIGRTGVPLPVLDNAVASAVPTQLRLEITPGGQFYVDTGFVGFDKLQQWLAAEAKRTPGATLLILFDPSNPIELLYKITDAANAVGIRVQLGAMDRAQSSQSGETSGS